MPRTSSGVNAASRGRIQGSPDVVLEPRASHRGSIPMIGSEVMAHRLPESRPPPSTRGNEAAWSLYLRQMSHRVGELHGDAATQRMADHRRLAAG